MMTIIIGSIVIVCLVLFALWAVPFYQSREAAQSAYWSRDCMGGTWRKAFPDASKDDIREYLHLIVDAFGFEQSNALKFAPTDTLEEIYTALYPTPAADGLELETLERSLRKRYGGDTLEGITERVSLGDLFSRVSGSWPNKSLERSRDG